MKLHVLKNKNKNSPPHPSRSSPAEQRSALTLPGAPSHRGPFPLALPLSLGSAPFPSAAPPLFLLSLWHQKWWYLWRAAPLAPPSLRPIGPPRPRLHLPSGPAPLPSLPPPCRVTRRSRLPPLVRLVGRGPAPRSPLRLRGVSASACLRGSGVAMDEGGGSQRRSQSADGPGAGEEKQAGPWSKDKKDPNAPAADKEQELVRGPQEPPR